MFTIYELIMKVGENGSIGCVLEKIRRGMVEEERRPNLSGRINNNKEENRKEMELQNCPLQEPDDLCTESAQEERFTASLALRSQTASISCKCLTNVHSKHFNRPFSVYQRAVQCLSHGCPILLLLLQSQTTCPGANGGVCFP